MTREEVVKNGHAFGGALGITNLYQASPKTNAAFGDDKSQIKTDTYHLKLMLINNFLGWPVVYGFNTGFTKFDGSEQSFWMMTGSVIVLFCILIFTVVASKIKDWLYFGLAVFTFACVTTFIIPLEFWGYIHGFMSEYLKHGEPYLFSSWGAAICLFDAIGFCPMYFLMAYYLTNGRSWRSVGLYWSAGILNSLFVLLVIVLFRIFNTEKLSSWHTQIKTNPLTVLLDLTLAIGFIFSFWIIVSKALVVVDMHTWLSLVDVSTEKALLLVDPAPFAIVQISLLFFCVLPMITISIYHLLSKEKPHYLWETTVIHCGLLLQAQFSYILYSLDSKTPESHRADSTSTMFWFSNLLILIVPHLFLLRLYLHRGSSAFSNAIIDSATQQKMK